MKYFSHILLLALASVFVVSCTQVEPIDVEVNGHKQDTDVAPYKASDHAKTLVWFDHWDTNGGLHTYLSSLPDSLDMAIVPVKDFEINSRQKTDLEYVKAKSQLTLILPIDINAAIMKLSDDLDAVYNDVVEEHPELDEDNAEDMKQIQHIIDEQTKKIQDAFAEAIHQRIVKSGEMLKPLGFDGLCIQANDLSNPFVRDVLKQELVNFKHDNQKILIVQGDYKPLLSVIANIDYIIDTINLPQSFKALAKMYNTLAGTEGFKAEKLLLYANLNQSGWNKPFDDEITSGAGTPRVYAIANWKPVDLGKVGLAVYGDFQSNNHVLRTCIQYVSHK